MVDTVGLPLSSDTHENLLFNLFLLSCCFCVLICYTFLRINELSVGNFVSSLFTKLIENCIKILPAVWFWTFYNVGTTFFSFELIVLEFQKKVHIIIIFFFLNISNTTKKKSNKNYLDSLMKYHKNRQIIFNGFNNRGIYVKLTQY